MHIFIDPNPDIAKSYEERLRLFHMPRSKWSDYNVALISKGGGVFSRDTKSITLSSEIKSLLDINVDNLDPDALIRAVLRAKVDLLWNGGIGTYVKSESETHAQIENKSNDSLRVNGKELRCKVVGEGGNLGLTQLGRVEYALNGGFINTDFIDNSGGVDCSDHEVNIKIGLSIPLADKELTKNDRDKLLVNMRDEVAILVLADNLAQDQSISISEKSVLEDSDVYKRLISILEEKVGLDCKLEFLPSSSDLSRRYADKLGLTRPELAVLSSYSKKAVYASLILSMLPHDAYYETSLLQYFPTKMRNKYSRAILKHPLRKEIVATIVANNIINHTGIDFFHLAQDYTGLKGCDIARAYSIVWFIFGLEKIWQKIEMIKGNPVTIELFENVRLFMHKAIFWFLRNQPQPLDVGIMIEKFGDGVLLLIEKAETLFTGMTKTEYQNKVSYFEANKVNKNLSSEISKLSLLSSIMDVVDVSKATKVSVLEVGKLYFYVGEKLDYNWLRNQVANLPRSNYWDRMVVKALGGDIDDQQRRVLRKIALSSGDKVNDKCTAWEKHHQKELGVFYTFIRSLKESKEINIAKLVVATKQSAILVT